MSVKIGTVTMRDAKGKTGVTSLRKVGGLSDVEKIADWLKNHTDAQVIEYSYTESKKLSQDDDKCSSGKYDRCEQRLILNFYDSSEGEQITFSYPAPRDEDLDEDQQPVSDVAEDVKDLIAATTTREGTDLLYNGGGLKSKMPRLKKVATTGV